MPKSPAFQFYPGDWLSSETVLSMTPAEEGAYIHLLAIAWMTDDCGLPDDDAALAVLSRLGEHWFNGSGTVVRRKFVSNGERLFNERLLEERKKQAERSKLCREAGIYSGKARRSAQLHDERTFSERSTNAERNTNSSFSFSSSLKTKIKDSSERLKIASSPASDSSPVFLQVPLKNGKAYLVTESDVAFWEDAYRSVDVRRALKQIAAWNDANPGKRKTARGIRKHITAWLSRDQDKILFPAGNNGNPFAETPPAGRDPNRWTVEDVNGAPDWED